MWRYPILIQCVAWWKLAFHGQISMRKYPCANILVSNYPSEQLSSCAIILFRKYPSPVWFTFKRLETTSSARGARESSSVWMKIKTRTHLAQWSNQAWKARWILGLNRRKKTPAISKQKGQKVNKFPYPLCYLLATSLVWFRQESRKLNILLLHTNRWSKITLIQRYVISLQNHAL